MIMKMKILADFENKVDNLNVLSSLNVESELQSRLLATDACV